MREEFHSLNFRKINLNLSIIYINLLTHTTKILNVQKYIEFNPVIYIPRTSFNYISFSNNTNTLLINFIKLSM